MKPPETAGFPVSNSGPGNGAAPLMGVRISHLGAGGDGAARLADGGLLHLPDALPGEEFEVSLAKDGSPEAVRRLSSSPDRVTPVCPHYGPCGGCCLQHARLQAGAAWKAERLAAALARAGFAEVAVAPVAQTPPASRRRMEFAAQRIERGLLLGLHQEGSKAIIDLAACSVLHPDLAALLAPMRAQLAGLAGLRHRADVLVNLLDTGPDILIRADAPPEVTDRAKLAAFAQAHGVMRIAWAVGTGPAEIVAGLGAPRIGFAGVDVSPPPGAFLQASAAGEAAIVAAILAGLPGKLTRRSRIIELFAGVGTLSFALAQHAPVTAYEGNAQAHAALARAAGGTRVQAVLRDLARQPLQPKEMAEAACVVLDPPFGGAAAQIGNIAASGVGRVIYVSCNPQALARDAQVLAKAGYRVVTATPVDQFLWSAQLEAVVVFAKGKN